MNNAVVGLSLYTHNPERTACAEEGTEKESTSGSPTQKAAKMAETGAVQMENHCLDSLANERTEGVLTMPIELWWWVEPLFETGSLTLLLLAVPGLLLDDVMPQSYIPITLGCIGILPLAIDLLAFVVWIVTNVLILIWGC